MPLRKDHKRRSGTADSDSRTADVSLSNAGTADRQKEADDYEELEEDEAQDAWLESLGVENSEIRKINNSQVQNRDTPPNT